ncbi:hypothetical protein [Shewanella cutis]|uniref:Uncharacterized protein n=1 Tax=Shewanella cutis TaxID=2766780 RepID=A0ABS9QYW6_9GAMM|nr:hypothetical protein [Shewanella sp. PS-2]MCG9964606.1 hypothetical protein [Shewanella sp. PS-2]
MSRFDLMADTVKKICESLRNEPEKWVFETHTFYHVNSPRVTYWRTNPNLSITDVWDGHALHTVFSKEQGREIQLSLIKARESQANDKMKMVIEAMQRTDDQHPMVEIKLEPVESIEIKRPWWKFWG